MKMHRRSFLNLLGTAAAAWPLGARAQQVALPVIGLLNGVPFDAFADRVAAWRQGLKEAGFVEGQNVAIEYRSADGRFERLSALADDLVRRQVTVIVPIGGSSATQAAKTATATIPIVFVVGGDPVASGLVASLNRPEANVTGMSLDNSVLGAKRLEFLRELLPQGTLVAFLTSTGLGPSGTSSSAAEIAAAARVLGREIVVVNAKTALQVQSAFATVVQQRVAALVVNNDAYLNTFRDQIIALAARHALPVIYPAREYVRAGGLMSYGVDYLEMYRQAGIYTGRVLKGEQPGNLPVMLPTRYQLVMNNRTAETLGLDIPLSLLIRLDEVIE
jgi:putative ABC transport system substrate-binding protein